MNWDDYFMGVAMAVGAKSKDASARVGCVLVGADNEVRATGFNGFPRGVDEWPGARHQRPEKYLWTEHAERNAIYAAARTGVATLGCRAYLPWFPCMDCARALVQAGIVELVAVEPDLKDARWGDQFAKVITMLGEANVGVRYVRVAGGPAEERGL